MREYVILADSCCDISPEARADIGMTDYIPGHMDYNGTELMTTLDWSVVSKEEYFKTLSDKKSKVTTAPPSPAEFAEAIESYVKQGKDVILMTISSAISGTYNFCKAGAMQVQEKYPEAKIYPFDCYRMTGAIGLLAYYAHKMKQEGKSFDEVVAWLEENKKKVHQMGPIDDLIFIARRGRISMGKAIMGSLVGVKPMGDCNSVGYTTVITKAKGIGKALDLTVEYFKEMARDIENQVVFIANSDREAYANLLKEKIEALEVAPKKVYVTDIYSACGANIGPGMVGIYFLGDEISEDMANEKAAIAKITGK